MMKRKINLMLVILALCLGCISCTNAPEDTNEPADDAVNVDDDATAEPQKGFSEITETGEEKFDPDAMAQDIEFSYEFHDAVTNLPTDRTEYHVGENIAIDGMITNVSDKVLTYTKVRGMFVKLCLYCETDDGRYEMSYHEMKHNTVPPQEVEFVPGRTITEVRYCFKTDESTPAGTYHLKIGVPGFQQTFYGVLTVVERNHISHSCLAAAVAEILMGKCI